MSQTVVQRLQAELDALWLVDPHTHINPHSAPSRTLADILGYHYYTELAHSAGIPREHIEEPGLSPRDKVGRIVPGLAAIENTVQYSWLLEICRDFFGFQEERITESNWERLYDQSLTVLSAPGWEREVLGRSRLSGVFLTNDFDDPLQDFDTTFYIPCLRTDDLVFRLGQPETRGRFQKVTGQEAWEVVGGYRVCLPTSLRTMRGPVRFRFLPTFPRHQWPMPWWSRCWPRCGMAVRWPCPNRRFCRGSCSGAWRRNVPRPGCRSIS